MSAQVARGMLRHSQLYILRLTVLLPIIAVGRVHIGQTCEKHPISLANSICTFRCEVRYHERKFRVWTDKRHYHESTNQTEHGRTLIDMRTSSR